MQDRVGASVIHPFSYFRSKDQELFTESHTSRVLHRAPVKVNYSDLVVLIKGVGKAENSLEVLKTLLCY